MTEAHLTRLEEQIAHIGRVVDELNEVVTAQAGEIDRLAGQLRALAARLAEQQEADGGSVILADRKPPHW